MASWYHKIVTCNSSFTLKPNKNQLSIEADNWSYVHCTLSQVLLHVHRHLPWQLYRPRAQMLWHSWRMSLPSCELVILWLLSQWHLWTQNWMLPTPGFVFEQLKYCRIKVDMYMTTLWVEPRVHVHAHSTFIRRFLRVKAFRNKTDAFSLSIHAIQQFLQHISLIKITISSHP